HAGKIPLRPPSTSPTCAARRSRRPSSSPLSPTANSESKMNAHEGSIDRYLDERGVSKIPLIPIRKNQFGPLVLKRRWRTFVGWSVIFAASRSEERRVGQECRPRRAACADKQQNARQTGPRSRRGGRPRARRAQAS